MGAITRLIFVGMMLCGERAWSQPVTAFPLANTPLTGSEYVPLIQNGKNTKATVGNIIGSQGAALNDPVITGGTLNGSTINAPTIVFGSNAPNGSNTLAWDQAGQSIRMDGPLVDVWTVFSPYTGNVQPWNLFTISYANSATTTDPGQYVSVYGQFIRIGSSQVQSWGATFENHDTRGLGLSGIDAQLGIEVDVSGNGTAPNGTVRDVIQADAQKAISGGPQLQIGTGVHVIGPSGGDADGFFDNAFRFDGSTHVAILNTTNAVMTSGHGWLMALGQDISFDPSANVTLAESPGGGQLVLTGGWTMTLTTPASSSAACGAGQFAIDANFVYVCAATNTWKRAALSTF